MIYAAIFAATSAFTFLCLVLIEQMERWGDTFEQYDESALHEYAFAPTPFDALLLPAAEAQNAHRKMTLMAELAEARAELDAIHDEAQAAKANAATHQIAPRDFDIPHAHGTYAERVAAARFN